MGRRPQTTAQLHTTTRRRERVVHCPQFGARLIALRGGESRGKICRLVNERFGLWLDRSTLFHYEGGTVKAPDPAILYALADLYGADVFDLIELLLKERTGRPVAHLVIGRSKLTREQRKIIEWFGELSAAAQTAVTLLMGKLHAAEVPPQPRNVVPVRRRTPATIDRSSRR